MGDLTGVLSLPSSDWIAIKKTKFNEIMKIVDELSKENAIGDKCMTKKSKYCEWKLLKQIPETWDISCQKDYIFELTNIDFEFCPYCGRKIKEIK